MITLGNWHTHDYAWKFLNWRLVKLLCGQVKIKAEQMMCLGKANAEIRWMEIDIVWVMISLGR